MTILWSFSYNFFIKLHGINKIGSRNMTRLYPILRYNVAFINELHCI